ncbi:hypothetical protein [Phenylobacterium montanum]|uniref:Uncharacterized protein n=1 Tax=Phenylobacterium montanum TaxID=2823693 RepID=A0A975G0Q0_9CAUL|nr:hypothetical protein [Caulobacter sp. S6]QUD88449.1 hypothetical protein KCG34_00700 [Caulobacter sp. S6]
MSAPLASSQPSRLADAWMLWAASLVVTLIVGVQFLRHDQAMLRTLGDTDDAMRLVRVRTLLAGQGWWDQWIGRLQPPQGTIMHWSRLLDGGLAATVRAVEVVLPPDRAELWTRTFWPLAWILPAAAASLSIAHRIAGRAGLFAGALVLVADPWAFIQFQPGRIDHHNVQIALTLAAAALALGAERGAWRGAAAGFASALCLAIGIEALAFHAFIGAGLAVGLVLGDRRAPAARAYGFSLAGGAFGLFLIQTPPSRWPVSACDALGANLVAGLVAAGLGLGLVSLMKVGARTRLLGVAVAGLVTAIVYLALDPACIHGPMAAVDPRLRPFWFDRIEELQPWTILIRTDPAAAVRVLCIAASTALAAAILVWRKRLDLGLATLLACAGLAVAATLAVLRQEDYAFAFGLPLVAAAAASLTSGRNPLLLATVSLALSPAASMAAAERLWPVRASPSPNERCYEVAAYQRLAAQPEGLVLADINLGPFILAQTPHSALAAPYHRMTWGVLAAHYALGAPPGEAEAQVRALGVRYIVECGALIRVGPGSFETTLRRGPPPPWLRPLSEPGEALQIYAVEPLAQHPPKER